MHLTKLPGRIYVEKTLKQCCFGCRNSQKTWEVSDGTSTQLVACIINKWRAKINQRRLYNVRDPLGIEGSSSKNWKESTIALRTEIVFKFERNIIKNYPPQTLTEEEFLYIKLSYLCPLIIFFITIVVLVIES